jgi:hypothetical protein
MAYYRKQVNDYGLPLDSRETYAKLDWALWTATLTQKRSDFEALMDPLWRFLNESPDRVPMTDWFWTKEPRQRGAWARPVLGGAFLPMLNESDTWKKWASRDKLRPMNWGLVLQPPIVRSLLPTSETNSQFWRFTTTQPPNDWMKPAFDTSTWREGQGGFGTNGVVATPARTPWTGKDIWLLREFSLTTNNWTEPWLRIQRSCGVEVFINGELAAVFPGSSTNYQHMRIKARARNTLKPGHNIIAIHAQPSPFGGFIDLGLVDVREP